MASEPTRRAFGPALAWGIWMVGALILAAILLLGAAPGSGALGDTDVYQIVFLGTVGIYATVGAAIAARRPDHYAGWTLLVTGVAFGLVILCVAWASFRPGPDALPGANWTAWITTWAFVTTIAAFGVFFLLHFPDGHLPGRRWRYVVWLALASMAAYAIGSAFDPAIVAEDYPGLTSPIAVPQPVAGAMATLSMLGNAGMVVAIILSGVSLVGRYRRAASVERLQIKWVAYVGVGIAIAFPIAALQWGPISDIAYLLGFLLVAALPLAVAFAILRYRLYEIDRLISRTFVYGALTAFLAGLYAASLRLFQGLFVALTGNESDAALVLTTLVLATTLTPMKARLEHFASGHLGTVSVSGATGASDATTASRSGEMPPRPFTLDDPADVAALEAVIKGVVRRELAPADRVAGATDGDLG
ncbi:MAG TPA: hypothetical protein VIF84_01020 [Candidatus Limnocylindrales bacterium]